MLIGLNGRKQAGKDTVYERAAHVLAGVTPVERASFADPLYESAAAALGVTVEWLQGAKSYPILGHAILVTQPGNFGQMDVVVSQTIREFLQHYGTEAHRDVFGADFWVEQPNLEDHGGKVVMVTDVRFENEARAVRRAGGFIVQVVGPDDVESAGDGHASEAPLPVGLIDVRLENKVRDDDFHTLDKAVRTVLEMGAQGLLP